MQKKIMVADESTDTMLTISNLLSADGFNVPQKENLEDALEEILKDKMDLAVVGMKVLDREGFLDSIKKLKKTKIVLMCGFEPDGKIMKIKCVCGFVHKPVEKKEILAKAREVLGME